MPPPEGPTTASFSPGAIFRLTCSSTGPASSLYEKLTSRYSTSPFTSRSSTASGASCTSGSVRMSSRKREKPAVPCM